LPPRSGAGGEVASFANQQTRVGFLRREIMVKEGYWYGLPLVLAGGVTLGFGLYWPGKFFLFAAAVIFIFASLVLNFFRDPDRIIPTGPGVIVSPADGRVVEVREESEGGRPRQRVSIFMSPLNVHVNRSPIAGTIQSVTYRKGSFRMASEPAASVENEQNVFTVCAEEDEIIVKQIAGVLARRIVFWKNPGDKIERGERVGLIKFGSRVDILVSPDVNLCVQVGQRVWAGSSVIGITRARTI
jgi:phosphatidylserine decarboxylase